MAQSKRSVSVHASPTESITRTLSADPRSGGTGKPRWPSVSPARSRSLWSATSCSRSSPAEGGPWGGSSTPDISLIVVQLGDNPAAIAE